MGQAVRGAASMTQARAYLPLPQKYRPQRFDQLVGQEAVASTLTSALRQNRIAPAYLFSGPRGTGKTSSATDPGAVAQLPHGSRTHPRPLRQL